MAEKVGSTLNPVLVANYYTWLLYFDRVCRYKVDDGWVVV